MQPESGKEDGDPRNCPLAHKSSTCHDAARSEPELFFLMLPESLVNNAWPLQPPLGKQSHLCRATSRLAGPVLLTPPYYALLFRPHFRRVHLFPAHTGTSTRPPSPPPMSRSRWRPVATAAAAAATLALAAAAAAAAAVEECSHAEAVQNVRLFYRALLCESAGEKKVGPLCRSCHTIAAPESVPEVGGRISRNCAGDCCIDVFNGNAEGTVLSDADRDKNVHVFNVAKVPRGGFRWVEGGKEAQCVHAPMKEGVSAMCGMKACRWRMPEDIGAGAKARLKLPATAGGLLDCPAEELTERMEKKCMIAKGEEVDYMALLSPAAAGVDADGEDVTEGGMRAEGVEEDDGVSSGGGLVVKDDEGGVGAAAAGEKVKEDGSDAKSTLGAERGLSLGSVVGIALGGLSSLTLLACCCFFGMKSKRDQTSSVTSSRLKGDEVPPLPQTLLYDEPETNSPLPDDVDVTFGIPPPRPEDSFIFPPYVQLFYPYQYPELGASPNNDIVEPSEPHSPMHLAIAIDTSRSGASTTPTRKRWAAALTPFLRSLAARCRGHLSVALVSYSGDTAREIPVDVPKDSDRTSAFGHAIETITPPRGEGMRKKARAAGHISAVDEAWDAVMRLPQETAARRRVLLLTASGDISGGETYNMRAHQRAGIWQPPPGVVVAALTDEARPETLVQLGGVAFTVEDVAVLGTSAGTNSLLNLLLKPTSSRTY